MKNYKKTDFIQNYLLICEYASLSQSDKINILGIFENITGPMLPVTFLQMYLVSNTTVPAVGIYNVNILLEEKDSGKEILKQNYDLEAQKDKLNFGIIAQLVNIAFPTEGLYVFKVVIEEHVVAEKEIRINVS